MPAYQNNVIHRVVAAIFMTRSRIKVPWPCKFAV